MHFEFCFNNGFQRVFRLTDMSKLGKENVQVRRRHEPDEDGKFWDRASVTPQGSFVFFSP